MNTLITKGWKDYTLLDSGNGKRLEQFGPYTIVRPDPQILWHPTLSDDVWEKADAVFEKNRSGKEAWTTNELPAKWEMQYKDLQFYAKLSPFKHTGVFPEQHLQWDWIAKTIQNSESRVQNKKISILNLFAYTGISSLVAAKAGAHVTHVDASYPTIGWARENQTLSGLQEKPIRWILDDCVTFVEREAKRGVVYDGIIMDPPVYGHGPKGEKWDFPKSFPYLLEVCQKVLSKDPVLFLINAYAISASSLMLQNVLKEITLPFGGVVTSGELVLDEKSGGRLLSTGIYGRWAKN